MDKNIITYPSLDVFGELTAFTTCRQTLAGEEKPRFTGSPQWKAEKNRNQLAGLLGLEARQLVFPRQTHTNVVVNVSQLPANDLNATDALVTDRPGICLCVQTADCVPILLYEPVKKVIAAIHAGWRGTVSLIVKEVIATMQTHYSISPNRLRAVIGPSIGPERYEIGDEVAQAVTERMPNAGQSLFKPFSDKYHLNLWEANRQVLLKCGVLPGNIDISGHCTYADEKRFFSARREGIETGRLVSGILLRA